MVRFSSLVIAYFTMGAVMWGSGVLEPTANLGVVEIFFDISANGAVERTGEPQTLLGNIGNNIGDVAGGLVGPILAVWTAIRQLIGVLFWPVVTMVSINAPTELVVLLGGVPTVAFFMGVIRTVRESA